MSKLTQKELIEEGILRSGLRGAARLTGGVLGGLKAASDAGVDATWSGVGKGVAAGWEKEKQKQKSPQTEWAAAIKAAGFFPPSTPPRGLNTSHKYPIVIKAHPLKKVVKDGREIPQPDTKASKREIRLLWDKDSKSFNRVSLSGVVMAKPGTSPTPKPTGTPAPAPAPITSSYSQKNLLRQLTLLSD